MGSSSTCMLKACVEVWKAGLEASPEAGWRGVRDQAGRDCHAGDTQGLCYVEGFKREQVVHDCTVLHAWSASLWPCDSCTPGVSFCRTACLTNSRVL